jgi:hypothetical protein
VQRVSALFFTLFHRVWKIAAERWKGYDQSHGHHNPIRLSLLDEENQAKGGDVVTISVLMNIMGPNHMGLKPSLVMIGTQRPTVTENVLFSSVSNLMVIGMSWV